MADSPPPLDPPDEHSPTHHWLLYTASRVDRLEQDLTGWPDLVTDYADAGDFARAERLWHACAPSGEPKVRRDALIGLASGCVEHGLQEQARGWLDLAIAALSSTLSQPNGDDDWYADYEISDLLIATGQFERAVAFLEAMPADRHRDGIIEDRFAKPMATASDDAWQRIMNLVLGRNLRPRLLAERAPFLARSGDISRAEAFLTDALNALWPPRGTTPSRQGMKAIAQAYLDMERIDDAVRVADLLGPWERVFEPLLVYYAERERFDEAIALARRGGWPADWLAIVAAIALRQGRSDVGQPLVEEVWSSLEADWHQTPWPYGAACNIGAVFLSRLQFDPALEFFRFCVTEFPDTSEYIAQAAQGMAKVGELERALVAATEAHSWTDRINDPWHRAEALEAIAAAFGLAGAKESARAVCVELIEATRDPSGLMSLSRVAGVYREAGVEVDQRARALLAEIMRAAEAADLDCGALSYRQARDEEPDVAFDGEGGAEAGEAK